MWAKTKVGIIKYAWALIYAPVNVKSGKGREKMREFWDEVNECLEMFEEGRRIVMFGDMNGRVGTSKLAGVVGKWGVDEVNENGAHLVDVCAERGLFLSNTFFQHKMIHRYTWRRREDGGEEKSLIDYIAIGRKDVMDAKVVRGALEGSDHYAVVVKIMLRDKWEFCRKSGREKRSKVLAKEKLEKEEVREKYRRKLSERLRGGRTRGGEEMSVNDVYDVFKGTVTEVANEVLGWRERKGEKKKEMHGGQMKLRMQ